MVSATSLLPCVFPRSKLGSSSNKPAGDGSALHSSLVTWRRRRGGAGHTAGHTAATAGRAADTAGSRPACRVAAAATSSVSASTPPHLLRLLLRPPRDALPIRRPAWPHQSRSRPRRRRRRRRCSGASVERLRLLNCPCPRRRLLAAGWPGQGRADTAGSGQRRAGHWRGRDGPGLRASPARALARAEEAPFVGRPAGQPGDFRPGCNSAPL